MTDSNISIYNNIGQVTGGKEIPIDLFLDHIQSGKWQDEVLKIRSIRDKNARQEAKRRLPYACVSGVFSHRSISGIVKHSGFICLDFDDLPDPEGFKEAISRSEYLYAAFVSCSGNGVAALIKIDSDKHNLVFDPISEYFFNTFGAIASTDKSCRDVSRARFVSFDPHLFVNEGSKKWTRIEKKKVEKKQTKSIFVQSDFDEIIATIQRRGVDICPSYNDWLRVGFAIADAFGESGRYYFEVVSSNWSGGTASDDSVRRQYNQCLKNHTTPNKVSISTFYYYCIQCGIETYSQKTKEIAQVASLAKNDRRDRNSAMKYLTDEGYVEEECKDIVDQVYDNDITVEEDSKIEMLEAWIKYKYTIRRNCISRALEVNGAPVDDYILNDIWRMCNRVFPKTPFDTIKRLIVSSIPEVYNPVTEFFDKYRDLPSDPGIIDRYFDCIESTTGGAAAQEYVRYFARRWAIGIISTIYGDHSNLMLVLVGQQDTGKTEFFRRMMPAELKKYFVQSSMARGKDDMILMAKRIIIFDDELCGKTKGEENVMKNILSKDVITEREPYGTASIDMPRICTFCACSNEDEDVLRDPTGNRRILPINVKSINFNEIDNIDRIQLWVEMYRAWKSGEDWRLNKDAKDILTQLGKPFESRSNEEEALIKMWRRPKEGEAANWVILSDILNVCQSVYGQGLKFNEMARALRKLNWRSQQKRIGDANAKRYNLIRVYADQFGSET